MFERNAELGNILSSLVKVKKNICPFALLLSLVLELLLVLVTIYLGSLLSETSIYQVGWADLVCDFLVMILQ